jgi:23S rRNA (uracil1939-C5)-methyltransferase
MLSPGHLVPLTIDKPAAGGAMIGRAGGQVVMVGGAIPGERVVARIARVANGVAYADTVSVEAASADRRSIAHDTLCGGCLYAHIAYPRQLELKSLIIADAFGRIAHAPLASPVPVAPSAEAGYRMRARLHVRDGRAGFFREGTHELCDPRPTEQLLPVTCEIVDRVAREVSSLRAGALAALEVSENIAASERVLHLQLLAPVDVGPLEGRRWGEGLTGVTVGGPADERRGGPMAVHSLSGSPFVTDVLALGGAGPVRLRRHVLSFFQGNRYLLESLVTHVVGQIPAGGDIVDLYAGAGLFSIAVAAVRGVSVTAVEGDRVAAADLEANAVAVDGLVRPLHQPVERFLASRPQSPAVLIIDPPRTGLSRDAAAGVIGIAARRIVYVSCDVATLARDARRLLDAGYTITRLDAFDLFPNTPHVETVAVFDSRP